MTHLHPDPDQTITRVLTALRDTEAPTGLEARILHSLELQQRRPSPSPALLPRLFARLTASWTLAIPRIVDVLPALSLVLVLLSLVGAYIHHRVPPSIATIPQPVPVANPGGLSFALSAKVGAPGERSSPGGVESGIPSRARPLSPIAPNPLRPAATVPTFDQLALEETSAPSQPTPPMPLTAQERLLLRATRPGAPIEVAELEQLREPLLRSAAEARQRAGLHQYLQGLLGPLAIAEALQPTPPELQPPQSDPDPPPTR